MGAEKKAVIAVRFDWKLVNILDDIVDKFNLNSRTEAILIFLYEGMESSEKTLHLHKQYAHIKKNELIGQLFDDVIRDKLKWEGYLKKVDGTFQSLRKTKAAQSKIKEVCVAIWSKVHWCTEKVENVRLKKKIKSMMTQSFGKKTAKMIIAESNKYIKELELQTGIKSMEVNRMRKVFEKINKLKPINEPVKLLHGSKLDKEVEKIVKDNLIELKKEGRIDRFGKLKKKEKVKNK